MSNRFNWKCSYLNSVFFDVLDGPDGCYEIELRHRLSDYESSIYNGGADAYRRDCGHLVGMLRAGQPIDLETVEAFNAWRAMEHASQVQYMRERPQRYGPESDWADSVTPQLLARGAAFYDTGGWHFVRLAEMAEA